MHMYKSYFGLFRLISDSSFEVDVDGDDEREFVLL